MASMIAAAYLRKSTDETDKDTADKSVVRQLARAREYAGSKSWTLDDRFVFSDDGVSGAEFSKKRPGFQSLMASLSPRPGFQILIVSEQSRLGRDTIRTLSAIQQIQDAGVRIFGYLDDREISVEEDMDEINEFIRGWSSSQERRKASQRTRDQKRDKASQGRLADGRVLGYCTVGDPKSRRREIDPAQAKIVVRIFEMCAAGKGLLKITKTLNGEGVVNPTGQSRHGSQKASKLWATSGIREVLHRELYRGQLVYGKTKWERRGGTKRKVVAPEREWIRVAVPELRIVAEALWTAAHDRLQKTRRAYLRRADGSLGGKPEGGALESKYLLSGFLRCGACGGNLIISTKSGQRGRPMTMFICSTRRTRGEAACTNKHGVPASEITVRVLDQLKHVFLNPVALGRLVMRELEQRRAAPEALETQKQELTSRIEKLNQELERAAEIVFAGTAPSTIMQAMNQRETERSELRAKLEHLNGLTIEAEEFDLNEFLTETKELLEDTRLLLEVGDPVKGRQVLRSLLVGPITVTPRDGGFTFSGSSSFEDYDFALSLHHKPDLVIGVRSGRLKNREVAGRIDRRVQKWCPRGDSNTRPAV